MLKESETLKPRTHAGFQACLQCSLVRTNGAALSFGVLCIMCCHALRGFPCRWVIGLCFFMHRFSLYATDCAFQVGYCMSRGRGLLSLTVSDRVRMDHGRMQGCSRLPEYNKSMGVSQHACFSICVGLT